MSSEDEGVMAWGRHQCTDGQLLAESGPPQTQVTNVKGSEAPALCVAWERGSHHLFSYRIKPSMDSSNRLCGGWESVGGSEEGLLKG